LASVSPGRKLSQSVRGKSEEERRADAVSKENEAL